MENGQTTFEIPRIISVDDHVLEPPDVWVNRLPKRYVNVGPRVRRERGVFSGHGMELTWAEDPAGKWADVWYYEDRIRPLGKLFGSAGYDTKAADWDVATFDELRPGCIDPVHRLADMDLNHTDASVCFPNFVPRFCGQAFLEATDKELSLLCVQAYNDWMIDEWCAGPARGRLIPLTLVPLWDVALATEEVRRCAAKGSYAVTFSENPYALGLPSIHTRAWDPFFAACEETGTTVCMHIGSSSQLPKTSPDAPHAVSVALMAQNAAGSLADYVLSGTLERFPTLRLAFSEANVGWMPYVVERMDQVWHERPRNDTYGSALAAPPSTYLRDRVFGCIIEDETGMLLREQIGMGQICFETDYPHADSKWPGSREVVEKTVRSAGLTADETYKFVRGNAIRAFGLERFGITA